MDVKVKKRRQLNLRDRVYVFALDIIKFVSKLPRTMVISELSHQLLRSAMSVAANYEEASAAFTKKDFTHKLSISFKESKESNMWLRLMKDSGLLKADNKKLDILICESMEITKIFGKSVKTSRKSLINSKEKD